METEEGSEQVTVIKRHTPIPVRKQQTYTLRPDQSDFCLHVLFRDSTGQAQSLAKVSSISVILSTRLIVRLHYRTPREIQRPKQTNRYRYINTEPIGNLYCSLSLCSMNTSTQFSTAHFLSVFVSMSVSGSVIMP